MIRTTSSTHTDKWKEKRTHGVIVRKSKMDTIKEFVTYAASQGSKSPEKYYISFSKMQTALLFPSRKDEKNLRDNLTLYELSIIEVSDRVMAHAIQEGIRSQKPYKEVFKSVKARIKDLAISIGT